MTDAGQSSSVADHLHAISEEWPDNDVDANSTEGARAAQRAEDALYDEFERQATERERQFRGPDKAYEISKELYEKAEKANGQLTEEERALLLSRGDVVGKALAHPDELTVDERYKVLQWSPPDELHAAIRKATGGALSTPEELYAMAHNGNFAHLSPEAKRILASKFWIDATTETHWPRLYWSDTPGNWQAAGLLYERAGMDVAYFSFASLSASSAPDPAPNQGPEDASGDPASSLSGTQLSMQAIMSMMPPPSLLFPGRISRSDPPPPRRQEDSDDEDGPPKKRTRASRDPAGNPAWPPSYPPELAEPSRLFWQDVVKAEFPDKQFEDVKPEVTQRWQALSEAEQAAYAARSEKLRGQAWDQVEEIDAQLGRGETARGKKRVDLPGFDEFMARQEQELEDRAARSRRGGRPRGPPRRETRHRDGQMAWPMHVNAGRFKPLGLFWDDQKAQHPGQELGDVWKVDDVPDEVRRRFEALGEEDRAAYEARSEKLRQEVWDEWEEYERRQARGEAVNRPQRQHP
ncbi:hypothetical protein QBC46DRAFT_392600 [Diplogelasinospora grovesii]|uniref:Uncharacterized protein n=1 Tax=Diplogelasinospora grovesii TaxID=303347 RepID=A0AAN6S2I7_9PEZI|nr:hypothetical protein QBC46DRAFT_392600 [Diplogelasinospora grovesii]